MAIAFKDLSGPKGIPFIGNLHQFKISGLHTYLEKQAIRYGDVFKIKLGLFHLTVVTRPELIQKILKSRPAHFRRLSKMDRILKEEGIHGVFNAEGEEWKVHRRIVTRGLDIKHQQQFFPVMLDIARRLYTKMIFHADTGSPYPIQEDLSRFTVDVTTSLAFGISMNTLEEKGGAIQDHMEKLFPMIFKRIRLQIPFYKIFKSKKDREYSHALNEIDIQLRRIIDQGKERLRKHPELKERPDTILESLLIAAEEETSITEREIKGNLLTLLMAGEDTTSHSMAWAIYLLSKHPDIQKKLQQEADEVLGDSILMQEYSQHELLSYTNAVIQEVLRLKSVAPSMLVEPVADIEIENYHFKKGSTIILLTRSGALRDHNFSDSHEMIPERWLRNTGSKCPVHNLDAFLPFGSGPRLCPGKNLAMLEMKLVLSMIAKNFDMEMARADEEVHENLAFTMMPGKFEIYLRKRSKGSKEEGSKG